MVYDFKLVTGICIPHRYSLDLFCHSILCYCIDSICNSKFPIHKSCYCKSGEEFEDGVRERLQGTRYKAQGTSPHPYGLSSRGTRDLERINSELLLNVRLFVNADYCYFSTRVRRNIAQ